MNYQLCLATIASRSSLQQWSIVGTRLIGEGQIGNCNAYFVQLP